MIKIGKTYIDDEFRWALSPSFGYEADLQRVPP